MTPSEEGLRPLDPRKPPKERELRVKYTAWRDGRRVRFHLENQHPKVQKILDQLLVCKAHGDSPVPMRCPSCSGSEAARKITPEARRRRAQQGGRTRWAKHAAAPASRAAHASHDQVDSPAQMRGNPKALPPSGKPASPTSSEKTEFRETDAMAAVHTSALVAIGKAGKALHHFTTQEHFDAARYLKLSTDLEKALDAVPKDVWKKE